MSVKDERFWRDIINSFAPEVFEGFDLSPPPQEEEKKEEEAPVKKEVQEKPDDSIQGTFSKISFNMWMFLSPEDNKYYMIQTDNKFTDYGKTTLGEAIDIVKSKKRKRKP